MKKMTSDHTLPQPMMKHNANIFEMYLHS